MDLSAGNYRRVYATLLNSVACNFCTCTLWYIFDTVTQNLVKPACPMYMGHVHVSRLSRPWLVVFIHIITSNATIPFNKLFRTGCVAYIEFLSVHDCLNSNLCSLQPFDCARCKYRMHDNVIL